MNIHLHKWMKMQKEQETDLFDVICRPPSFCKFLGHDLRLEIIDREKICFNPPKNERTINCLPDDPVTCVNCTRPTNTHSMHFVPSILSRLSPFSISLFYSTKPMGCQMSLTSSREDEEIEKTDFLPFSCYI